MKTNGAGLDIIKASETLRLVAYLCPAGKPTIGWGHTGKDVYIGMPHITKGEADDLLAKDVEGAERDVLHVLGTAGQAHLTKNQFSAMVSLCFNIGCGHFKTSSVANKHKEGDFAGAAEAFKLWNKCDGKVLPGLVTRRAREKELYLTEDADEQTA